MIAYPTFCQLRQAWDEEHLTMAQIARALDLHPQTVKKWVGRPRYEQRRAARRASILDEHKPAITRWLAQHPFTATQLWQRLRDAGYPGGCSIVRDYVRTVRPARSPAYLTLAYAPGQCAQIDWGSAGAITVGGTRRACEALGAVPAEMMVDNCKTAVLSHRLGEPAVFNPHYLDFARHYGFTVKACGPRQPQAKGRVENAVGYVKKNFLAGRDPDAPGGLAALNAAARIWLETVANARQHGETKRTPTEGLAEERVHLRPLPANPYEAALVRTVQVSNRCRVTIDTNRYSVPPRYASAALTLQLASERLRLFDGQTLVADHVRSFERRQDFEQPDHVQTLLDERKQARHQRVFLRFLALAPVAAAYHAQLAERRLNVRHHLEKIVALAEIHGPDAVSRALTDAHALGAYSCEYIANLLEQRGRLLPVAGALHLTRAGDLLDLELPPPDLSPYDRS